MGGGAGLGGSRRSALITHPLCQEETVPMRAAHMFGWLRSPHHLRLAAGPCRHPSGSASCPSWSRVTRGIADLDEPVDAGLPPARRGGSLLEQPKGSTGMQTSFWAESLPCRVETSTFPWKHFFIRYLFKDTQSPVIYKYLWVYRRVGLYT